MVIGSVCATFGDETSIEMHLSPASLAGKTQSNSPLAVWEKWLAGRGTTLQCQCMTFGSNCSLRSCCFHAPALLPVYCKSIKPLATIKNHLLWPSILLSYLIKNRRIRKFPALAASGWAANNSTWSQVSDGISISPRHFPPTVSTAGLGM